MKSLLKYVFTRRLSMADAFGTVYIVNIFKDEPFNAANLLLVITLTLILVVTTSYLRGLLGADQ